MPYTAGAQLVAARLGGALTCIKNKGSPERHLFAVMCMQMLEDPTCKLELRPTFQHAVHLYPRTE